MILIYLIENFELDRLISALRLFLTLLGGTRHATVVCVSAEQERSQTPRGKDDWVGFRACHPPARPLYDADGAAELRRDLRWRIRYAEAAIAVSRSS